MDNKCGAQDSPVPNTKKKSVVKKKNISCQTEPVYSTSIDLLPIDLTLGSSPSVTPCKISCTSDMNSSIEIAPADEASSSAYMSAESLKSDPISTPSNTMAETPCESIPVIQKDMDAMSINFETPYLSSHKRVQRKLSLPQIKLLKKNSSQESDSPPDNASGGASGKKPTSSSSSRFFSSLKKRKHALKRALSFQNSSTSSEDKVQPPEQEPTSDSVKEESDKPKTM